MIVRMTALACLVVTLVGTGVMAATLRVPSEYGTIQQGLDASQEGDTILVAPGVYREHLYMPSHAHVLTSEEGRDMTVIWADQPGVNTVYYYYRVGSVGCPAGTEISGFTIRGSNTTALAIVNGAPTIRDNIIAGDPVSYPGRSGGIHMTFCDGVTIRDNVFTDNRREEWGSAIRFWPPSWIHMSVHRLLYRIERRIQRDTGRSQSIYELAGGGTRITCVNINTSSHGVWREARG